MKTISFKKFMQISKWMINFSEKNLIQKLQFYIESPFRYKLFRTALKAQKYKIKEIDKNDK